MGYLAGNALAWAAAALLAWLAGALVVACLPRESIPADLRCLARWCCGIGFWIAVVFVLCAADLLSAPALYAVAAVVAFVAAAGRCIPGRPGFHPAWTAAWLVLVPWFVLAQRPGIAWDADTYHLTLPRIFVEHGGFRPVELSVYSTWPLNTELLFAAALAVRDHVLAKLLHFGFGALVLYALLVAGRRLERPAVGLLAGALFLANPVVLFEMTIAYVDLAHAFFFLATFLFLLRAREADGRGLLPAGICAGLLSGVKLTGIVSAALLGLLLVPGLLEAARRGRLGVEVRRIGLTYALPVVLLSGPWLVRAWWLTGNPFYPFLYAWFGGPDWSVELGRQLAEWQRGIGAGRAFADYLLLPFRVILQGGEGYDRFSGAIGSFWIVVLPLGLLFARSRPWIGRALVPCGLFAVFWAATSQQMRLLIPVLPFAALVSSAGLVAASERWIARSRPSLARGLALAAGCVLLAWVGQPGARSAAAELPHLLRPRQTLLESAVPPVYRLINHSLPPDARLLFINTNHGFHCRREYLADSFFEASQIAAWLGDARDVPELRRRLADRGITHLLLADRDWGIAYPAALYDLVHDPARSRVLASDGRTTLIELLPVDDRG